MESTIVMGVLLALLGIFILVITLNASVNVRGENICLLERKYVGKEMVGRTVALRDEVGLQARTLGPGFHWLLPPFIYKTKKEPFTVINEGKIGLVRALAGATIPSGQIFAKVVECDNFQDGEGFIKNGGQKGPQVAFLPPGQYMINPYLFEVVKVNNEVGVDEIEIPKGQLAIVTATDGKPLDPGRLLGKRIEGHENFSNGDIFLKNGGQKGPQIDILQPGTHRINTWLFNYKIVDATIVTSKQVGLITAKDGEPLPPDELIAISVEGHSNFQDAQAFLNQHGQRGPQLDILKPGTYYINPLMFEVNYTNVAEVQRGQVAVIISNVGKEPLSIQQLKEKIGANTDDAVELEKRLDVGIERYVVAHGYRGIQEEVSGPGVYYLNTMAFIPHIVDTTNITIDWDEGDKTQFNPLAIVSGDAFQMNVSVKVIIRIRPDQAPHMIAKIGSIENLINHVIHPMIDSSFRNQASATSAMNFMKDRHDEQKKAEDHTREELAKYHVELVSVLICQIDLPADLMATQTARVIAEQQLDMYGKETEAQNGRIAMEAKKAEAEKQGVLVQSSIDVQIAENLKKKTILDAEGKGGAKKAEMSGEAEGTELLGKAKGVAAAAEGKGIAEGYEEQKKALTSEGIVAIEISKQIAIGNIKITPDIVIQGGNSDGSGLLPILSGLLVQKLGGSLKEKTPVANETEIIK
ncbi:MAG: SPFH domain-containing protein [Patescibacteria group bacterium]|jgi:regulator of protease activity HflC (stomatin/prohibitin superfamily)